MLTISYSYLQLDLSTAKNANSLYYFIALQDSQFEGNVYLWGTMAERFSASDSRSDGWVVLMWVRILAATCGTFLEQDTLLWLLLFTKDYKWVPARVEVDIVFEKVFGAEKDYRNDYWPSDQGTNVKRIEALLWNAPYKD